MVEFFYVRKLIESKILSRDFAERQFKVIAYPAKGEHVHWLNYRRDPDELFKMEEPRQRNMKIEQLANQLIHSYIFYLITDESGPLQGILVASVHIRDDELLSVSLKDIIRILALLYCASSMGFDALQPKICPGKVLNIAARGIPDGSEEWRYTLLYDPATHHLRFHFAQRFKRTAH